MCSGTYFCPVRNALLYLYVIQLSVQNLSVNIWISCQNTWLRYVTTNKLIELELY